MDIKTLVERYSITINGDMLRVSRRVPEKELAWIKEHKPEIMAYIREKAEEERKARAERERKISEIEGLSVIDAAHEDLAKWRREFERSFDEVGGQGVRPKPQYDLPALYAKYPRACAYIKAREYSYSSNYAKAHCGKEALEKIINGEDYESAIRDMDGAWLAYCEEHIWD